MEKLIETKKLFIAKISNVHNIPNYDGSDVATELVDNALGYRLVEQVGKNEYVDVLLGQPISYKNIPTKEGALVINGYKRPLYRYCRSLRVLEKQTAVEEIAKFIAENYNRNVFNSNNHEEFYNINNVVRLNHINEDKVILKTSKSDLAKRLFGVRTSYDVDELFVVKTNMIANMDSTMGNEMLSCTEKPYKYILCIRKWNGAFEDVLTKNEINYFSENVRVGDIIVDRVRPLYRYAKSLHLHEDCNAVKVYAKFVDEKFNTPAYDSNHDKFNEINEVVRACHNNSYVSENSTSENA